MNTVVFPEETNDFLSEAEKSAAAGIDGLIVQPFGSMRTYSVCFVYLVFALSMVSCSSISDFICLILSSFSSAAILARCAFSFLSLKKPPDTVISTV